MSNFTPTSPQDHTSETGRGSKLPHGMSQTVWDNSVALWDNMPLRKKSKTTQAPASPTPFPIGYEPVMRDNQYPEHMYPVNSDLNQGPFHTQSLMQMGQPGTSVYRPNRPQFDQRALYSPRFQPPPLPPITRIQASGTSHKEHEYIDLTKPEEQLSFHVRPSLNAPGKTSHKPCPDYISPFVPRLVAPPEANRRREMLAKGRPEIFVNKFKCGCFSMGSCIHYQIAFARSKLPDGLICELCIDDDVPDHIIPGRRKCPRHQDESGLEKNHKDSRLEDFLPTDEQQERYIELLERNMRGNWEGIEQSKQAVEKGRRTTSGSGVVKKREQPRMQARREPYARSRPLSSAMMDPVGVEMADAFPSQIPEAETMAMPFDGELADAFPRRIPRPGSLAMPSRSVMASEPMSFPELQAEQSMVPPRPAALSSIMESIEVEDHPVPLVQTQSNELDYSFDRNAPHVDWEQDIFGFDPNRPLEPWEQDIFGEDVLHGVSTGTPSHQQIINEFDDSGNAWMQQSGMEVSNEEVRGAISAVNLGGNESGDNFALDFEDFFR